MDMRKTIIDILLSTRSLPEGVAADAIISAIGSWAEPVAYAIGVDGKITPLSAFYSSKRSAEQHIEGWAISGEDDGSLSAVPLYTHPAPTAQDSKVPEAWIELLQGIVNELSIMDDSQGVAGLHLNGEISSWDEGDLPYLRDRAAAMLSAAHSAPSIAEKDRE